MHLLFQKNWKHKIKLRNEVRIEGKLTNWATSEKKKIQNCAKQATEFVLYYTLCISEEFIASSFNPCQYFQRFFFYYLMPGVNKCNVFFNNI